MEMGVERSLLRKILPFFIHLVIYSECGTQGHICHRQHACGGQRTTLWSWFALIIFKWVLEAKLRSPGLHLCLLCHLNKTTSCDLFLNNGDTPKRKIEQAS